MEPRQNTAIKIFLQLPKVETPNAQKGTAVVEKREIPQANNVDSAGVDAGKKPGDGSRKQENNPWIVRKSFKQIKGA